MIHGEISRCQRCGGQGHVERRNGRQGGWLTKKAEAASQQSPVPGEGLRLSRFRCCVEFQGPGLVVAVVKRSSQLQLPWGCLRPQLSTQAGGVGVGVGDKAY